MSKRATEPGAKQERRLQRDDGGASLVPGWHGSEKVRAAGENRPDVPTNSSKFALVRLGNRFNS